MSFSAPPNKTSSDMFGIFDKPELLKNQSYNKIKTRCITNRTMFIDTEFPPKLSSLFSSLANYDLGENEELAKIVWKRPGQICTNPFLFVNGISTNDVLQGRLGNCWFVAACTCITVYRENWLQLIPDYKSQEWTEENKGDYCGIFRFRFWKYGSWVEVVIDDLLPTLDNDLIYCHSIYKNEFWSALLEKAYAKLLGSYEALEGGELIESLVDFSGGIAEPITITEEFFIPERQTNLFQYILRAHGNRSLIAAAVPAISPEEQETETKFGLIIGHAYAVTNVVDLPISKYNLPSTFYEHKIHNGYLRILRLRNPWGQGEWKGPFCDRSPEWEMIPKTTKNRLCLSFKDDGEFWITFVDFLDNFKSVVICHQLNTVFNKLSTEHTVHGEWSGKLVGGCLNFKNTFLQNPQYTFTIDSEKTEEIQMSLTQKMIRELNRNGGATGLLHIGYSVLRIEANRKYRVHNLEHCLLEHSSPFKNGRSIFLRIFLKRGHYLVVPSTFNPGERLSFMFRIYCKSPINFIELKKDSPSNNILNVNLKIAEAATRLSVIKAVGLQRVDALFGANPFIVLTCENQKSVTSICHNTLDPEWDESFIFYRKHVNKEPIFITLYSKSDIVDEFIGRQTIYNLNDVETDVMEFGLCDKTMKSTLRGTVFLQQKTYQVNEFEKL